ARLGDHHHLVVAGDRQQVDHLAVALAGADVDQALAAAALHAVLLDRGALAVAALAHGEQRLLAVADHHVDHGVAVLQLDAAHAAGPPAPRPHVGLVEPDRHAVARAEHDALALAAQSHADQPVALVEADGDDAARPRPAVGRQLGLLDLAEHRGGDQEAL